MKTFTKILIVILILTFIGYLSFSTYLDYKVRMASSVNVIEN